MRAKMSVTVVLGKVSLVVGDKPPVASRGR